MKQSQIRAAYHEAAHTVHALAHPDLFARIRYVTIGREGNGMMAMTPSLGELGRRRSRPYCVNLLAGQEAERLFFGTPNDEGTATDHAQVEATLARFPPRQSRREYDHGWRNAYDGLEAQAAEFVTQNRTRIEALARALLRHRRISGRQAMRIVEAA